ncbi:MAG TPA: HD domain-containing protein, partial [Thermoanaerobaculia bacterium]|nr:HD domain-containing protein [Thermoanaerobaculia bacterium]
MTDLIPGHLASAVNARALYPANHPRVVQSVETLLSALQQKLTEDNADEITYILIGDDLVVGDELVRRTNLSVREFIDVMKSRGIERLTLARGLDREEAHHFIGALAGLAGVESTAHVIVGRVQLVMEAQPKDEKHRQLSVEQLEVVREAWARFRVEKKLPVEQLEELVWSFIDSVARTTRAMLPLASLKDYDEYTFVHSVNVSLLVLAQAKSFGIWGPMLHNFGMAGLLHDIGKLVVPLDVLNKPGKLDEREWDMMKTHAREGAWYLSAIDGTPSLAVIVAYEHHLR